MMFNIMRRLDLFADLGESKNELTKEFNLRTMSEVTWERQRDGFLDRIATIMDALDMLITWGWVKSVGQKGGVYEVTGTGYTKADWLKDGMCIDTSKDPLEELKQFEV